MNSQGIVLSEDEHIELSRRIRSATISQRDGRRAWVILLAAQGRSRNEIARLTGLCVVSVTRWCKRFQELCRLRITKLYCAGTARRYRVVKRAIHLDGWRGLQ